MSRTKQTDAPFRRSGGKHGSGITHVRYGHNHRPTQIHVRCPRCGSLALALKPSESDMGIATGDVSGTWHLADWTVACSRCPLRLAGLAYESLPPLFFEIDGIFAWNRDHLHFLSLHISGHDTAQHPYRFFTTYIRGEWLRDKNRTIKLIRRLIKQENREEVCLSIQSRGTLPTRPSQKPALSPPGLSPPALRLAPKRPVSLLRSQRPSPQVHCPSNRTPKRSVPNGAKIRRAIAEFQRGLNANLTRRHRSSLRHSPPSCVPTGHRIPAQSNALGTTPPEPGVL